MAKRPQSVRTPEERQALEEEHKQLEAQVLISELKARLIEAKLRIRRATEEYGKRDRAK